jgi:hypothetical protein
MANMDTKSSFRAVWRRVFMQFARLATEYGEAR